MLISYEDDYVQVAVGAVQDRQAVCSFCDICYSLSVLIQPFYVKNEFCIGKVYKLDTGRTFLGVPQVAETLIVVDVETKEAEAKKVVVSSEEAIANEKATSAKAIKDECEGELAVAMPLLESALAALNTLTKGDISEVKAMKNPPAAVKTVMEAVCHLLSQKPVRIPDPANPSRKIDDYWKPSQGLLGVSPARFFLDVMNWLST